MTLTAGEPGESVGSQGLAVWRMLQQAQVRITRGLEADLLVGHDLALASYDVLLRLSEASERRLRIERPGRAGAALAQRPDPSRRPSPA
ncbi:hypothetical protein ACIBCT_12965 [Streptosporangium sp. NPDC050855]|uniref:hypothetical protein n=1 Tax=Streptosporangium sp. NPDC050855 TaxID=3366194 RepID=UPI0037B15B4A